MHFTKAALTLFTIALLLPTVAGASGSSGWTPQPFAASPSEVIDAAAGLDLDTEDAAAVVLLEEVLYRYDAEGRETKVRTVVFKMLTEAGVDRWDTVRSRWQPWHQKRPTIEARVITPDGQAIDLDPATISEAPDTKSGADVFDDRRVLEAPLPSVKVNGIVEQRVTVTETTARFPGGTKHHFYPWWRVPAHQTRLVIEVDDALALHWKAYLSDGVEPTTDEIEGGTRWVFEFLDPEEPPDAESGLPFDHPRYPHIAFSTGGSWPELAGAYAEVVAEQISAVEDSTFSTAEPPVDGGRMERIAAALRWVRDRVRYTGLEFGRSSIVPYTPSATVSRGYGDCKDQATLMVALLRRWGVDADVALLRSGFRHDVDPELPGLGAFNHAIVHIPGDPAVWVDTTAKYHRFGSLPAADAGRMALIANRSTQGLTRIPHTRSEENGTTERRVFELQDEGKSRLTTTAEYLGAFEGHVRSRYASSKIEDLRDSLDDWVKRHLLADELGELEFTDPENMDEAFTLRYTVDAAKRGFTAYGDAIVAIRTEDLLGDFPEVLLEEDEDEVREGDFIFPVPFTSSWSYRAVPPKGFVAADLPDDRVTELGTARLEETFTVAEDGAIEASLTIDSGPRIITGEELEATRKALIELQARDFTPLYFVHRGQRLLQQGKTAEGLAELARLAEADPDVALHQARLAQGLLAVGLGEEARAAARKAVTIDEACLTAHTTLAWVLQHDLVGRMHGPGFDLAGAVAAYRKAQQLEGYDLTAWLNLAILLEYDADGRRYSPAADLDGAIAEYSAAREAHPDDFGYDHNLVVAMLWDRRYEQIVELFPDLGDNLKEDVIVLTAVAATAGIEEAHRRARLEYRDAQKVREALIEIAQLLGQQRFYPEAAAAFRLAAQGADDATALQARAFSLESSHRLEDMEIDLSTPAGIVKQALVFSGEPDGDDSIKDQLLSDIVKEDLDDDQLEAAGLLLAASMRQVSKLYNLPTKVLIDLTIGGMEWLVDGSSSPVRRVHMRSLTGDGDFDTTSFVVEEDGVLRLLCTDTDVSPLGRVALDLLDADNLAGAAEVLDWARDLVFSYDSGDPLDGPPFARLWERGSDHDAAAMRLAALCLAADGPLAQQMVPAVEAALQDPAFSTHRTEVLLALLSAHTWREDYDGMADVATEILETHPNSWIAFAALTGALIELERYEEAAVLAEQRLERRPGDIFGLRMLANAVQMTGELDRASELWSKVAASSEALSMDFNNRAWLTLFRDSVDDRALVWANSAAARASANGEDYAALHTLATLYADRDRPAEAYQVIVKAMDPNEEPGAPEWYVFGRMAETYGFVEAARAAYGRVIADGEDHAVSTAALARRRLAGLEKAS